MKKIILNKDKRSSVFSTKTAVDSVRAHVLFNINVIVFIQIKNILYKICKKSYYVPITL